MAKFKPSKWNGRKRRKPVEPFAVLHCTAGKRATGIARFKAYFSRLDGRHACYHYLAEDNGLFVRLMHPGQWVAYHSRRGGNDGVGISGCYSVNDWVKGRKKDGWWAIAIMAAMADAVLDFEELCGVKIAREYRGPYYDLDRLCNDRRGFYGHTNIDPKRRSDPLWTDADWRFFLKKVLPAREAARQESRNNNG